MNRTVHVGAWWIWALGLAAAATRTTNPLLLGLIIGVAALVVATRGSDEPWGRSFGAFCRLGLFVVSIRILFELLFGAPTGGTALVTLPEIPLPQWAAGIRLGGAITAEAMLNALYEGLRLFAVLACVGAANSLADPRRLLKSVPGALYEVGVAVVVALSVTPSLILELQEVRQARRLRGRPDKGIRGVAGSAMPVLGAALERSVALAAAMDSRGYGRTTAEHRRLPGILTVGGLIGVLLGIYGLLDAGSPGMLGLPLMLLGTAIAVTGLAAGHRHNPRTRYRPDPWRGQEWAISLAGVVPAAVLTAAAISGVAELAGPVSPPAWPALPLLPAAAILIGAAPAMPALLHRGVAAVPVGAA